MTNLYQMFNCADFKFNHTDPTQNIYGNASLLETREKLFNLYMKKALEDLSITTKQ
jgi:hypothetical protein